MDALHGRKQNGWKKGLTAITPECWEQYWTSPGASTPQSSSCTATYNPSRKLSQIRQIRYAWHCWRTRNEVISDVLLWNPSHGQAKAGWPAWTYMQQVCEDTGSSPEDLPKAMNNWERWRERLRDIRADATTRWWWHCMTGNCISQFTEHKCYNTLYITFNDLVMQSNVSLIELSIFRIRSLESY